MFIKTQTNSTCSLCQLTPREQFPVAPLFSSLALPYFLSLSSSLARRAQPGEFRVNDYVPLATPWKRCRRVAPVAWPSPVSTAKQYGGVLCTKVALRSRRSTRLLFPFHGFTAGPSSFVTRVAGRVRVHRLPRFICNRTSINIARRRGP